MDHPTFKRSKLFQWFDQRLGFQNLTYPVPSHAQTLPYMLGGLAFISFVILITTGIYLAQFYNPNQVSSNSSVLYLISQAPFGNFIRSIHYWTANIMFILILLHMVRVFIAGSYKSPREFTWLTGLILLAITMGFIFTGTMLSLTQEGLEALEHNSEIGLQLGLLGDWFSAGFASSLPLIGRVYVGHIVILPVLFLFFLAVHFYLIKFHGISAKVTKDAISSQTSGQGEGKFSQHLKKLIGMGMFLLSFIAFIALLFPEPLDSPGVVGIEASKPPWMFLWIYGLENIFGIHSLLWGPLVLFTILSSFPFIDRSPYTSPKRRLWVMTLGVFVLLAIVVLSVSTWLTPIDKSQMNMSVGSIERSLSDFLIPVAYAHNMPVVSFSPAVISAGQTLTVSGDGMPISGTYHIYLIGTQKYINLGNAEVVSGDDHFDTNLQLPQDSPSDMYTVKIVSPQGQELFAPLQLKVKQTASGKMQPSPEYTAYPIPSREVPWIIGFILLFLTTGIILLR